MGNLPFSLRTYLTFQRSSAATVPDPDWPPRPPGLVLWAHAGSDTQHRALKSLCARIQYQRPEIHLLMTRPDTGVRPSGWNDEFSTAIVLPPESLPATERFLTHWAPDLCLWASQDLRPVLTFLAARSGCHLALVDAADAPWTTPASRFLPDVAALTLAQFDTVLSVDAPAERRLRRTGVRDARIQRAGPLIETTMTLECSRLQHEEMAAILSGRPAWLAAYMRPDEIPILLAAHQRASRLNHRLLLFLCPAERQDYDLTCAQLASSGMRLCLWEDGETPDENTQIVLADGPDDLGLFFRLAPLALLGSSLVSGHGGYNPLQAAALGSAILYGPNIGRHLAAYFRLAEAGAARIVRDVDTLSAAVSQLIAPDRAAAMAHAGWDIVSAGAAMTDIVVDMALDVFDRIEAG